MNLKIDWDDVIWRTEKKKWRKLNRASETCGMPLSTLTYMEWEYQKSGVEKDEIMTEKFPNLMKNINVHIQESQQTTRRITQKDLYTQIHESQYEKDRDKEKILKTARGKKQIHIQKDPGKTTRWLLSRNGGPVGSGMMYSKCWREKTKSYELRVLYPAKPSSKNEEKII